MAKHGIRANRTPEKPKSEIRAAKSFHELTHPAGSAEHFLDEAAKEALVAAAAGGVITPRQAAVGMAKAVADEAERYPDPLLAEAAKLPREELMKRAARAAVHQRAMEAQNAAVRVAAVLNSPVGNMVANNAALTADEVLGTGQDWAGEDEVHRISVRQDAKGGDTRRVHAADEGGETPVPGEASAPVPAGPRIVINPQVFSDRRDALCVAFNEAFRVVMEDNGFEPVSEPTDRQRKFFADTAYADDELQLRRTILARIATLDTSVSDPTDEQLQETAEMLEMVMEVGAPQNDWEQTCVKRLLDVVSASLNGTKNPGNPVDREPPDIV